jgi:hypothetical protein
VLKKDWKKIGQFVVEGESENVAELVGNVDETIAR